jgi:hypothetical protein
MTNPDIDTAVADDIEHGRIFRHVEWTVLRDNVRPFDQPNLVRPTCHGRLTENWARTELRSSRLEVVFGLDITIEPRLFGTHPKLDDFLDLPLDIVMDFGDGRVGNNVLILRLFCQKFVLSAKMYRCLPCYHTNRIVKINISGGVEQGAPGAMGH